MCNNKLPTRDPLKGAPFIVQRNLYPAGAIVYLFGASSPSFCPCQQCYVCYSMVYTRRHSIAKQLRGDIVSFSCSYKLRGRHLTRVLLKDFSSQIVSNFCKNNVSLFMFLFCLNFSTLNDQFKLPNKTLHFPCST